MKNIFSWLKSLLGGICECVRVNQEDHMDALTCRVKTVFDIGKVLDRFNAAANLLVNYVGQPCVLPLFLWGLALRDRFLLQNEDGSVIGQLVSSSSEVLSSSAPSNSHALLKCCPRITHCSNVSSLEDLGWAADRKAVQKSQALRGLHQHMFMHRDLPPVNQTWREGRANSFIQIISVAKRLNVFQAASIF